MIDNNLKNAIAGEKLKHYKVNNPNLLARYVVMMSKIRSSASIGIIDLMFFLVFIVIGACLLYTSPSPRDRQKSRMPSSA